MQNSRTFLAGGVFGLFGLIPSLVRAQAADVSSVNLDPVAGLELVAPKDLPRYGTFWFLQRPNSPPAPCNSFPELPVYWLNREHNVFLLDDRTVNYVALYKERLAARMLKATVLGISLLEMEWTESGGAAAAYDYSTNDLWLEITGFTNCTASLVIHRPWDDTNAFHDLFYTTNLASPISWQLVQRCIATNVSVPNLGDAQGFFRLGQTNGSLTVTTNVDAQQMAQLLVPPWVTVTIARFTGSNVARGTFSGGHGCGLPLETGVILSSGDIGLAVGTNNNFGAGIDNFVASDTNLDDLVGGSDHTYNATALEFDIISTNSFALRFEYIFASEEYPEWIGGYNDPMAIFISTNRVGTNWIIDPTNNIALVPVTGELVSVSKINGGWEQGGIPASNPQYYVDNKDPYSEYSAMPPYAAQTSAFNVQYDGMTVLLMAQIIISANVTNHIKIGIEDYKDEFYDSAVLIKKWESGSCCQCR